ncbi:MAG: DinB family protein [Anaerolineae bacterium]
MDQIREKIRAARTKLLAVVEGLDEVAWDWQPGDGRWSARLTLAHVGSAHWSHLEVARGLVEGQTIDLPGFELNEWNEARVAERADWSPGEILADLNAAQDATLAFMAELEAKDLEARGVHPALGEVSAGQVLGVIALHDSLHRRDILKLLREMRE